MHNKKLLLNTDLQISFHNPKLKKKHCLTSEESTMEDADGEWKHNYFLNLNICFTMTFQTRVLKTLQRFPRATPKEEERQNCVKKESCWGKKRVTRQSWPTQKSIWAQLLGEVELGQRDTKFGYIIHRSLCQL